MDTSYRSDSIRAIDGYTNHTATALARRAAIARAVTNGRVEADGWDDPPETTCFESDMNYRGKRP
jgi:hypothetical protein